MDYNQGPFLLLRQNESSCENMFHLHFHFHGKETHFHMKRFKGANDNSEVVYFCGLTFSLFAQPLSTRCLQGTR